MRNSVPLIAKSPIGFVNHFVWLYTSWHKVDKYIRENCATKFLIWIVMHFELQSEHLAFLSYLSQIQCEKKQTYFVCFMSIYFILFIIYGYVITPWAYFDEDFVWMQLHGDYELKTGFYAPKCPHWTEKKTREPEKSMVHLCTQNWNKRCVEWRIASESKHETGIAVVTWFLITVLKKAEATNRTHTTNPNKVP